MTESPKEATVTFRTHVRIKQKLESIAASQQRSVSWVTNQLMMQILRDEEKMVVEKLLETL